MSQTIDLPEETATKSKEKATKAQETTKETPTKKWVYLFEDGTGEDKTLLGGKGAGLAEIMRPLEVDKPPLEARSR